MTAADVRAVTDDMRRLKDELMQRVRSGDINVHVEPIGIAFTKSELWDLTLGLTQLIGIADEYVALVESSPTRDELMQRVRSGDINVHVEPIGIAFTTSELWDLTLGLTQLIGIADEYVALVESGPSRDELLDASTAAAQAFVYAEEASERLGHIMGRLWLKPEPKTAMEATG